MLPRMPSHEIPSEPASPDRARPRLGAALALAFLPVGDFEDGVAAYREGRYEEALLAWRQAETTSPSDPRLLFDQALASLQLGESRAAEISAEKALAFGGEEFRWLRDFVAGNAAFARSRLAGEKADRPEAEPFLFELAIREVERARDHWIRAAEARGEWPEARRNIERALLELRRLRKAQDEAEEKQKKKEPDPPPEEPPPEEPPDEDPPPPEEPPPAPEPSRLSPRELARLLELLAAREKDKLQLRQDHRRVRSADVERDW